VASNESWRGQHAAQHPIIKDGEEQFQRKENDNPNRKTGLIGGVFKKGKKYQATIYYGGAAKYLGVFDTQRTLTNEKAGIAYDRAAIDKSSEEVSTKQKKKFVSKVIRSRILKNSLPLQVYSVMMYKKRKQKLKNKCT
tara:strand:- start:13 stop:426 length:414 start_codon:yes stop_codon:yes gene_type:complete